MASQAILNFFSTLNRNSLGVVSNNPGNLVSNTWTQSLPGYMSRNQEGFAVFATPGDGIDALQSNLRSYAAKGLNTPFKIASTWAPAGQPGNNPIAYAETIAKQIGVGPYSVINLADANVLDAVTRGIMMQENGLARRGFSMGFSIDPNTKMVINGVMAALGVIVAAGVGIFPDYVPPGVAKDVVQTGALVLAVWAGINGVGNGFSSNKQGVFAPEPAPVVQDAQAVADLPSNAGPAVIKAAKDKLNASTAAHVP